MQKTKNEIRTLSILGAGAVGCFYGSKLQKSGLTVEYLSKFLHDNKTKKLTVESIWGNYEVPVKTFSSTEFMQKADLAIVSSKVIDLERDSKSLVENLKAVVSSETVILILQNGINMEERIQSAFPNNVILGGLAFTCINRMNHRLIQHLDYGKVKIGANLKKYSKIAESVVHLFHNSGIECEFINNLRMGRYEKLLWNIPFNSLSVILNATTDELVKEDSTQPIARNLMMETIEIAKKDGIRLKKSLIETMIQNTIKMKPYKTSMLLDFEKGYYMEIESILGEPLRLARKYNLKTPHMETIYYLLKNIQSKIALIS